MNKLQTLFSGDRRNLLSVYFTAGYPKINDTIAIAEALEKAGADFLEIGFPYSDPLADGPVIQHSSQEAIENGMTLHVLFDQLKALRSRVSIPVLLMGYINPVLQYGMEKFCADAAACGVDGFILPDLPMAEYENLYKKQMESHGLSNVFLITPQTSEERIRKIDGLSNAFIYMLSSAATTGKNLDLSDRTEAYFTRIKSMRLRHPVVIGFGISNHERFAKACDYARGAIVGSAFVKYLGETEHYLEEIRGFISEIKKSPVKTA
ncbi:MAG: tryptophan synthase subunit alpha [Mucilaginibacter polytrichastri]|nr:tryptophan synthase subunit alpha [Mucilaginibacter polytrichastri]